MNFKPFRIFKGLPGFIKSTDFAKASILALAISLPIAVGVEMGRFEIGLALALGALLSSPSDVSGSIRHKNFGIALSAFLAVLASLIGGYLIADSWIGLPVLGVTIFILSYLAVFGFRASLISFSGLFALVLSFANISDVLEIYERAFLIGIGGVWYLGLTVLWQRINPKGQTDQFLAQSLELTAEYLETRGRLITSEDKRDMLLRRLLELQSELNEKHETLRDILISSRKTSGNSNYERKRLLIFIQLVDILEFAMANPVNYDKMVRLLKEHPDQILVFQKLIFAMAKRLETISISLHKESKTSTLRTSLMEVKESLKAYQAVASNYADEGFLMLKNLYDYQEEQIRKIDKIETLLGNEDQQETGFAMKDEILGFITRQEFDPKILLENLNLKSAIFKHSLRIAVVMIVGYSIGVYFSLQNAYWILLTIVVIMRPNYGLTKTRSKQRTLGTLIGAGIAVGIVFITQNLTLYAILAIISLVLAFATVQRNYKTSAVFVTLSVVFVYALLEPNVLNVIQFRVVDTLIGAGLATLGNLILWPSWEFFGIKSVITESIEANKIYFREVTRFYEKKGKLPTSYKLSRKEAFLGIGNLNTAFQRMTQEPKRKQKNLTDIYELTVLNHSFLSALASMGAYIQNHKTTEVSTHFKAFSRGIEENMERSLALLKSEDTPVPEKKEEQLAARNFFDKNYRSLSKLRENEASTNFDEISGGELQEAQLIYDQLKWLMDLSVKLEKKIRETKFQNE
ncbi:MAG: FUSC family membrane protein [Gillisia sp.]